MIKIGICGYGNLARGVEEAIKQTSDCKLIAVFTRRNPESINVNTENVTIHHMDDILSFKDKIDVMVLCGGSANDLPTQTPDLAKHFNVVDSFDTHAKVLEHYMNCDESSSEGGKVSVISTGWDPGMFSLNRVIMEAILPNGVDYTFWGRGVSQGHSDAIRRISGVLDAKQYTIPVETALSKVRSGKNPRLSTRQKHTRECYVVAKEGADLALIEKTIKEMPNYFADYDTTVHFITKEELDANHNKMPHGGVVIRSGETTSGNKHVVEYKLTLDSNPEFTGSVLLAYARAAFRLNKEGNSGCYTVLDIAPKYLSEKSYIDLLKHSV